MQEIEFTISTVEIAEMLDNTPHKDILKKLEGRTGKDGEHIKGYIEILTDNNFVVSDFFISSTYRDSSGKENKCYKVTKKGCEFFANKFTGEKGVRFTARYINRFHEMESKLSEIAKPEISTEQMEKLLGFMEKQQQFMEDQEKFNQMVVKKLESTKRIQAHQNESDRKIFAMSSRKKQIINLLDTIDDGDFKFLNQIYTMIKTHVRIICGQQYGT